MNIGEIGSLYVQNSALPAQLQGLGVNSSADQHPTAAFAEMFKAAAREEGHASSVPQKGPALGAAANSGAKDSTHAKKAATIDRGDKLYAQCRELETFLIKNLLSGLRKTVEKSELTDSGFAGQMYEDMLWDNYAESFSRHAGLGLADQVYLELKGRQG